MNISITNPEQIHQLLKSLHEDTAPLWGKMNARQMVEHLIEQTRYTNGTFEPTLDFPLDEAIQRKQRAKQNDGPMTRNVNLGPLPSNYEFPDLQSAIDQLMIELVRFDTHFATPGTLAIHGGFGPMDREEWVWWHNKHFTHHFTQFGLIEE